jgi:acyl-CoA synthetase (NDP forming)
MLNDRETEVVVSYIESLGDGRRFIEEARKLSGKKSLIILKSGKGESGSAAAYSHTGRLAGRYEVFRSVLRQFGIMEAGDFDELMDATKALSYQRPSIGSRVCIITNGGGSGVLAADECMRQGLNVPRITEEKLTRIKDMFPKFYVLNNPFDLTAQVRDEDYLTVLDEVKDEYDGFLVIALPNVMGITEGLAELMKDFKGRIRKPVIFHIPVDGISRRIIARLEKTHIPVFPSPERAVKGLRALLGQDKGKQHKTEIC